MKFKLTEILPDGSEINANGYIKRMFFNPTIDDSFCTTIDGIIDEMFFNEIKETIITLAKKESVNGYFYCKHFAAIGETGDCGKQCAEYTPRNGKSGVCKHYGFTYEQTDRKFKLKLL